MPAGTGWVNKKEPLTFYNQWLFLVEQFKK